MSRRKLRGRDEVVERCRALAEEVRTALDRLPAEESEEAVVDALWHGEALGSLLWALGLLDLPPYDEPFEHDELLEVDPATGKLRGVEEVAHELEAARLWHWRARTTALQAGGAVELPDRWDSFDQLIAATAMRGYEEGLLPPPLRGDFRAFGKVYRHLSDEQHSEALSLAAERHHALAWVCGLGESWETAPLDT